MRFPGTIVEDTREVVLAERVGHDLLGAPLAVEVDERDRHALGGEPLVVEHRALEEPGRDQLKVEEGARAAPLEQHGVHAAVQPVRLGDHVVAGQGQVGDAEVLAPVVELERSLLGPLAAHHRRARPQPQL